MTDFYKGRCVCKSCQKKWAKTYYKRNKASISERNRLRAASMKPSRIERIYGLTRDQHAALLEGQGHSCAICRTPQAKLDRSLAVDHDHVTGKVRGLLCVGCNRGLGFFDDSEERLRSAMEYLLDRTGKTI